MNRVAWSFVVFVVLAGPMPAQETLAWKFQVGTSFQIESVDKSKRVLLWDKNETTRQSIDTWVRKYTVRKVTATEIVLDQTIVSVSSEGPAWASLPTPLATIADKLKGCTFRVTISPTGRVLKLEGYDNFVKKMSDGQADSEKSIRAACPESSVRKWLEDTLAYLPEKAVKPGDRWQRESQSASFSGTYKSVIEYEYKGRDNGADKITYTEKRTCLPPPEIGQMPVVRVSAQTEKAAGVIFWDSQKGLPIRGESEERSRCKLMLRTGENDTMINVEGLVELRTQWRIVE